MFKGDYFGKCFLRFQFKLSLLTFCPKISDYRYTNHSRKLDKSQVLEQLLTQRADLLSFMKDRKSGKFIISAGKFP